MIDKIGSSRPTTPAARAAKVKRSSATSGSAFADALSGASASDGVEHTQPVSAPVAAADIGGLLSIQEVSEESLNRQKSIKQGKFTLQVLEQLRDALLLGNLPVSTIRDLEKIVRQERAIIHDPRLNEVLDDIELRAAVELAKLEMSGLI